jgi:hypothetical protein
MYNMNQQLRVFLFKYYNILGLNNIVAHLVPNSDTFPVQGMLINHTKCKV